jgi:hypothetical protein
MQSQPRPWLGQFFALSFANSQEFSDFQFFFDLVLEAFFKLLAQCGLDRFSVPRIHLRGHSFRSSLSFRIQRTMPWLFAHQTPAIS